MPRQPEAIPRPRLTEPLADARVGLVEASGGYGKTTLARQLSETLGVATAFVELGPADTDARALVARVRGALRSAGLSDLASTLEDASTEPADLAERLLRALDQEADPVLLVLDDAHRLRDPDAGPLLDALSSRIRRPHRLLLLARWIDGPLVSIAERPGTVRLDAGDLAFTEAEVAALLARRAAARSPDGDGSGFGSSLLRTSAGWAAALTLLVDQATAAPGDPTLFEVDRGTLLARLLEDRLGLLGAERRMLVRQLATLPELSPTQIAEVTEDPGLFEAMLGAGLPLAPSPTGGWRLPDPVRERLAADRTEAGIARRTADTLARVDDLESAVRLLVGAGLADDAAALLAGLPTQAIERQDLRTVRAMIRSIPEASLRSRPRAWLHLARACDAAADKVTRDAALASVEAALAQRPDPVVHRELDAERARDLARDGSVDAAESLAASVLAAAPATEQLTRVRALHTLGRVAAWRADPASLAAAERILDDVVRLYRDLGMPGWSAHAALSLAYHVHHPRGESDAALARLDEALGGLGSRARLRAVLLTFKAEILIAVGRADESAGPHAEARAIGRALGDRRVLAYAAWNEARAASQAGDAGLTLDRLAETERNAADWFDHFTGVEFLADAAVLADRVGRQDVAERYLERAGTRRTEAEQAVLIAEAVTAARSGDPEAAEARFAVIERTPRLETRDRWWLRMLRAWAALRRGDDAADAMAEDAFRMAAAIDPRLPWIREPAIAEALRAHARTGSVLPEPAPELRVMGPTELRRGGRPVAVPPGRPAAILEMLAVAGELATEEVIERLWPGVEPDVGRARLRNTLNRLRDACGTVVERGDDSLRLAPDVLVDSRRYEATARSALAGLRAARAAARGGPGGPVEVPGALEAARAAVGGYAGTLLPGRPFEDWAAEARERLARLQLALIDQLAGIAERERDLDDAIRLRRAGIELDPDDETRHVALAKLLLEQGRRGPALAALEAGRAALAGMGLPPTAEMIALGRSVGRTSDGPREHSRS